MPIKHAALKEMRKARRRHARNQAAQSELKTLTKRFVGLLEAKQVDEAKTFLKIVIITYDRAAERGIIHRNTANRSKSRLTRRLNRLLQTQG